jgi:hypothetical protein
MSESGVKVSNSPEAHETRAYMCDPPKPTLIANAPTTKALALLG